MAKVSLRAYNREIESMIDRGQLDEAIAHSLHILKTFPKHLETYRLLGKAYLEYKRYNEAVDIFSRVLAAEPNDFVSNVGMSIIRDEENKMDDAIWHMERAFETQPSNPAIQSELQRLYGRRDGVQPPRIRMTRGALAHMYVQGELYPQAISEIKSVLKEDPGRSDMSVLLARAYYRSGQKNQAADEAAAVLKRYPYCLDANRVLVEIAGADRPEAAQAYRQRVIELDPYAGQVTGSIFQSGEVGDNAIGLEHLDWNGQSVTMQSDWGSTRALAPESGFGRDLQEPAQVPQAEPDWLKMGFDDSSPAPQSSTGQPSVVPTVSDASSAFDFDTNSGPAQPTPEEEIPEFLRAAGWGKSTGEFDESKSVFGDEPRTSSASDADIQAIQQGDLPDWVKAMAPENAAEPAQPTAEEDLPDWIKNIGAGSVASVPTSSDDQPDWMKGPEAELESSTSVPVPSEEPDWMKGMDEPAQPVSPDEQPDWMKGFEQPSATAASVASDDSSMDWLKGLDQPEVTQTASSAGLDWLDSLDQAKAPAQPAASDDHPDWMKGFEQPSAAAEPEPVADDSMDWLKAIDQPEGSQPIAKEQPDWLNPSDERETADDSMDWLKELDKPETAHGSSADTTAMWLKGLDEREQAQPTSSTEQPDWMKTIDEPTPQQPAQSEELDWLNDIGTTPEATVEPATSVEQPDWITQFGDQPEATAQTSSVENEFDFLADISETTEVPSTSVPSQVDASSLGKSEQERDDSFAWLEALAAKQGASEGLLTKPEERLQEEPEWVKQAKGETTPAAALADQTPAQPAAKAEDLGKSQQEIDDSLAWLENLAAKQGATEGLLTKPEDRLEQEPDWVKQAKSTPPPPAEQPTVSANQLGQSQQEIDDSLAWLENLAAKQGATEGLLTKPEERLQEEPDWVKQAKSESTAEPATDNTQPPPAQPEPAAKPEDLGKSEQERDDSFAWLEALAAKQGASEGLLTKPEERLQEEPEWVKQAKSTPPESTPSTPSIPAASVEDLGKSEQERDDSFAWLENLAAKQGATEGLLTKPEERREEEPEWVKQAKSAPQEPAPSTSPVSSANVEELGKSEQERDDSFAWLENLAAKQGATEGLLIKPEDRLEQEPEWVQQAKSAPPQQPAETEPVVEEPVVAEEDTTTWLRNLEQEENEPERESSRDETAVWFKKLDEASEPAPVAQPEATDDMPSWLSNLEEEESSVESMSESDSTRLWFKGLEESKSVTEPAQTPRAEDDIPAWLKGIEEDNSAPVTEAISPEASPEASETGGEFDWLNEIEEESTVSSVAAADESQDESLPGWLRGVDEETRLPDTGTLRGLPGWMRDETGEVMAEPTKIEPTRATDWQPVEEKQPEPTPEPESVVQESPVPSQVRAEPVSVQPVEEEPKPKPAPKKSKPAEPKPEPYNEPLTARSAGVLNAADDPMLGSARNELSRSNLPGALQSYEKLIKKGRFLEEVIFDLRGALDRFPVEVSILQALGDAYMRANRLQDALDAYTKAEELLR
jgi:tetratricopeptide (TPR) repeat protein